MTRFYTHFKWKDRTVCVMVVPPSKIISATSCRASEATGVIGSSLHALVWSSAQAFTMLKSTRLEGCGGLDNCRSMVDTSHRVQKDYKKLSRQHPYQQHCRECQPEVLLQQWNYLPCFCLSCSWCICRKRECVSRYVRYAKYVERIV